MKTIEETYQDRLNMLIAEYGSAAELSKVIDKSPAQISQWVKGAPDSKTGKPRSMKSETAREIEIKTGKPRAWFDQPIYIDTFIDTLNNNGASFGDYTHISGGTNNLSVSHSFCSHNEEKGKINVMPDNSLMPVIPVNSELWVSDETTIKNGKIYLVEYGGILWYRRLFQVPPNNQIQMRVFENNKDFEEFIVPMEQIKIIGRVIKWIVEDKE